MTERTNVISSPTIGGHFSALIENRSNSLHGNVTFESARSALFCLLKASYFERIHIPNYCCTAVVDAVLAAGCKVEKYPIGDDFSPESVEFRDGDAVLLINYFGVAAEAVSSALSLFPSDAVIVDCSQAYFQKPLNALATFYSLRKFLPVPDGGLLSTSLHIPTEKSDDTASLRRYQALLKRIGNEPELSRSEYLNGESSLSECSNRRMSSISLGIARTADLDFIAMRRRENYRALHAIFAEYNKLEMVLDEQVPLCYPLAIPRAGALLEDLRAERVFTPRYWPDVVGKNSFERMLIDETVFLPVDHRYTIGDMEHIGKIVTKKL